MTAARASLRAWAPWAMAVGGVLMALLWLVFTNLHGPTSFNEGRSWLGHDMHGWGMALGVVPNVLITAALIARKPALTSSGSRLASVGLGLIVVGMVADTAMNLVARALGPPLFLPLLGIGAVLLALGTRSAPALRPATAWVVGVLGVVLLAATALSFAPMAWSDSIGGYRIYGALAHLAAGVLWVGVAATLVPRTALAGPAPEGAGG